MTRTDASDHHSHQPEMEQQRVKALAAIVKIARSRDGKSIETSAKEAGVGHMTWRRLEEGNPVRAQTYAALDKVYELPSGTVLRAVRSDEGIVELANHFAIGIVEARESSPRSFVSSLSGAAAPTLSVKRNDRESDVYEQGAIKVGKNGVKYIRPPLHRVVDVTPEREGEDIVDYEVMESVEQADGPDRLIASASIGVQNGLRVTAGVTDLVAAADTRLLAQALVNRLVNSDTLTRVEQKWLAASLEVVTEASLAKFADPGDPPADETGDAPADA